MTPLSESGDLHALNTVADTPTSHSWGPNYQDSPHTVWDQELYYSMCYSTYRQTTEWLGVWDVDEFISPIPEKPWTAEWLDGWLDEFDDSVASILMPYTWMDKPSYGSVDSQKLLALEPDLKDADMRALSGLRQNSGMIRPWHHIEYYKSLHRTGSVATVTTHMGSVQDDFRRKSTELVVYHSDRMALGRDEVIDNPVTAAVLHHWLLLSRLISSIRWHH